MTAKIDGKEGEKMNGKDTKTLEMLRRELGKSISEGDIPERLKKENIVAMLKNGESEAKDFSDKTGTKSNVIRFRRYAAVAAAFIIVLAAGAAFGLRGTFITMFDPLAKSGYTADDPLVGVKSTKQVEKAARKIAEEQVNASEASGTESAGFDEKNPANGNVLPGFSGTASASVTDSSMQYPDIVKNDGEYIYIAATGYNASLGGTVEQIKILRALPAGEMKTVSAVVLSDFTKTDEVNECLDIYLKDNYLIALIKRYTLGSGGVAGEVSTAALFYDISDPTAPVKVREHIQDGGFVSSRIYGDRFCLITSKAIVLDSGNAGTIPSLTVNGVKENLDADSIFMSVNDPEASYLFVSVTDTSAFTSPVKKFAVLGGGRNVYCAPGAVYISKSYVSSEEDEQNGRHSLTEIYKFSSEGLTGSRVLDGVLPSGSFMDENDGLLRVLTLDPSGIIMNVLGGKMEQLGELRNIFAPDDLKNISFFGDSVYIDKVSGGSVLIDLSDPSALSASEPLKSGNLGDAILRLAESKILSAEYDPQAGSVNFELVDLENDEPVCVSSYTPDKNISFPGTGDIRCVVYLQDKNMFGIPVIKTDPASNSQKSEYLLFSISGGIIAPAGEFCHEANYVGDAAVRATSIGDVLYTVSGEKVTAFSVADGSVLATAKL